VIEHAEMRWGEDLIMFGATNETFPKLPVIVYVIAVGTAVADGPPRRSQRALLAHWAPPLGLGVEPRVRPGMQGAGGW